LKGNKDGDLDKQCQGKRRPTLNMDPALVERLRNDTMDIIGMGLKARIARSFAASYQWNVRNLEGHWYARSAQVWHDLTSHFPDTILVPQYPLWLTHEDQDSVNEDGEEGDNEDEEIDSDEEAVRKTDMQLITGHPTIRLEPDDDDQNCGEVDTTEDSLITLPEPNAAELLPDFVILHFRLRPLQPDHPRFLQLAGIRITHECCPIIIENKRMPPRRRDVDLYNNTFSEELEERLYEAMLDLEHQCAYAFKKYRHMLSVIAVAVAGDHWCHISVPFNYVSPVDDEYTMAQSRWATLQWPLPVAFGTSESDARLTELHHILERKARPNHDFAR
jgi:hypothetical protein